MTDVSAAADSASARMRFDTLRMAMSDSVVAARIATPRVSVIVPVHNGASTLEACLPPLLAHAPELAEVIVVDDRSTDGSGASPLMTSSVSP